jgi:ribonucleotide reductase beta subunit family protein with ferritin-like domain
MPSSQPEEPLTVETKSRHVLYPIQYPPIFQMFKNAQASYWVTDEINFQQDLRDLEKLTEGEAQFIRHILAFFAASDGIVMENLAERFMNEVAVPEAKAFYAFQIAMEAVHSETYSLLIDTYTQDPTEKDRLFNAVLHFDAIRQKADWALKWIKDQDASFAQRLIAFAIVEGVFFSASFCAIFWLRKRGLLPGLSFANQLISRDEGLHTEFACLLYSYIQQRVPKETVETMFREAVEIERRFITESIPCSLIGMNQDLMYDYIQFIADRVLKMLDYEPIFHKKNPFPWMEMSAFESKGNFFEARISEYNRAVHKTPVGNDRKDADVMMLDDSVDF